MRLRAEPPVEGPTAEDKERCYYGNRRHEILPFLPPTVRKLLDVGCGRGAFASNVKAQLGCQVWGVELNPHAARVAAARLDRVVQADVRVAFAELPAASFDCITFNDVLEHLPEPGEVIRSARRLLAPGGVVVASIPNVRHVSVVLDLFLRGRWEYADNGILDRTHLRFFTASSIRALFDEHGYRVRTLQGINRSLKTKAGGLAARLLPPRFRDMQYLQFAVVAEPKT